MQNRKEQDSISVNIINEGTEVKAVSRKPSGYAAKDPFCVYDHKRHAVGSKIVRDGGAESVCDKDGSWKNVSK